MTQRCFVRRLLSYTSLSLSVSLDDNYLFECFSSNDEYLVPSAREQSHHLPSLGVRILHRLTVYVYVYSDRIRYARAVVYYSRPLEYVFTTYGVSFHFSVGTMIGILYTREIISIVMIIRVA